MISVIVPAKDAAESLPACLDALIRQNGWVWDVDYEIIVVDDGSSDDTARIAAQCGVRVISQPNAGPASARNHGAQSAAGEILAFTDADCIPTENWLAELVKPFSNPQIVGVKGAYACRETALVPRFVQCEYAFKYERMRKLERIDFVDTYSAAYRRDVFLQHDGFNPLFRVPSVEDQEFSFRLARKGLWLVFQPTAVVFHRHDLDVSEYVRRKYGIGYWKAVMLRWLPEKTFSDSHTPPSQRWQILLLGMGAFCVAAGFFWPLFVWMAWLAAGLFFLTSLPFLAYIGRSDPRLLWIAPGMLLLRAAALAVGIAGGIVLPPANLPRKTG